MDNQINEYLDMSDDDIDNLLLGVNIDKKEEKDHLNCISCKSDDLVIDETKGHYVCQNCGVINESILDKLPTYEKEFESSSSYGCPTNPFFPKSALGTKIKARGYNKISMLQRQGQMPYKEKSLMEELNKIQDKCKKYDITQKIIDSAKILYKHINDSKHTKGKRKGKNRIMRCINRKSMIAACVFYACKLQGEPRSPKEIADIYSLEIKHVNRGCKKFIDYIKFDDFSSRFYSSRSSDFIKRFSTKLNIPEKHINKALDISNNIHKLDLASTHEPPSVAAGCLLLIVNLYNLDINKKTISEVFGISDVTISKTYRRIYPFHKIITNNEITELILKKKQNKPKNKLNLTKDNLVFTDTETDTDNTTENTTDNTTENLVVDV